LLAIVLGDADRLEALRILVAAELCGESWEVVAGVSTFGLDFFANLEPGVDHGTRITTFIDVLT
jgi:hypothetical protein